MNPDIWGPHAWIFLHTITLEYPLQPTQKDKENYLLFFKSLASVLPCGDCKVHYQEYITKNPLEKALECRDQIFKWLVDIHNMVNVSNGKRPFSCHEVEKIYKEMYDKKCSKMKRQNRQNILIIIILIILILFVILFFIFFIFNKKNKNAYLLRK